MLCFRLLMFHLQKYISLARELLGTQAKIAEKDEEIQELKSERTNTRVCGGDGVWR